MRVQTTEVTLVRSPRRHGQTWLRRSFGQPGLPQSFFVSQKVSARLKGAARLRGWKHVARDSVCRSRATALCACSGHPPLRCLRRRYVIQVDSPDRPAMPLLPRMPLRHSGPGRNVHARSRSHSAPTDQVGSGAWRARSARSPIPARRARFLPSRRNSMPRPNWN